jgi:NADPH:quinone reductase-like Zn-dependent oxidoreductase
MKAVRFTGKGGPEVVELAEVEAPTPSRGEVLVRVKAAAMNRADLLQRRGLYPPPPGFREDIPGLELAGEIAALGEAVTGWIGERFAGLSINLSARQFHSGDAAEFVIECVIEEREPLFLRNSYPRTIMVFVRRNENPIQVEQHGIDH